MKYLISFFFLLFASMAISCSKKTAPQPIVINTKDSVLVDRYVIVRDTIIVSDSASVKVELSQKDLEDLFSGKKDTIRKKNKQASLNLYKDKETGLVNADCDCDTMSIVAKLKDSFQTTTQKTIVTQTITKEVKYIPFFIKVLAWVGAFTVGYFIFSLLWKRVL